MHYVLTKCIKGDNIKSVRGEKKIFLGVWQYVAGSSYLLSFANPCKRVGARYLQDD